MDRYIEVSKLIQEAEKKGVSFGKSNPYNRLRYYTKIGLLPHMERKRNTEGKIAGHYPDWTIERLILIEKLKDDGVENEDIGKRIQELDAKHSTIKAFKNPNFRTKILSYSIIVLLVVVLLTELRIIPLGIDKTSVPQSHTDAQELTANADSGSAFIPQDENTTFVNYTKAQPLSKIIITFTQDYSPATKYWIKEIKAGEGFTVELDTKVFNDKWFNWYATN